MVLLLVQLIPAGSVAAQSGPDDAVSVVQAYIAAVNAGDLQAALTHIADNAIDKAGPNPDGSYTLLNGKAMIQGYLQTLIADHTKFALSSIRVDGDTVRFDASVSSEALQKAGIASIVETGVVLVQGGTIVSAAQTLTSGSITKVSTQSETQSSLTIPNALPNTGGGFGVRVGSTRSGDSPLGDAKPHPCPASRRLPPQAASRGCRSAICCGEE